MAMWDRKSSRSSISGDEIILVCSFMRFYKSALLEVSLVTTSVPPAHTGSTYWWSAECSVDTKQEIHFPMAKNPVWMSFWLEKITNWAKSMPVGHSWYDMVLCYTNILITANDRSPSVSVWYYCLVSSEDIIHIYNCETSWGWAVPSSGQALLVSLLTYPNI